jgi:hypothetical protein
MRFLPILTFLLILTTSLPVLAKAPINDEGAAKVKALVQSMIDQQSEMHTSEYSKFVTEGKIKVEQAKSYYAVTLPDITVISQREKDGETKKLITKIGIIGMNVIPTDNAKEWKMTVAIPTPIKYLDENKKTLMQMDIAQQQMVGTWNEDLNAFSKMNGQYRNIVLHNNDSEKKIRVNIDEFSIKSNSEQGANNLWSGPSDIQLSNLAVITPTSSEDQPALSIGNISIIGSMKDYAPELQSKLQKTFSALGNKTVTDPKEFTDAFPLLLNLVDSMAFKMSLKDLRVSPSANTLTQVPLELKEAFFGFGLHGLKTKMFSNNFSFGWHGLSGSEDQQNDSNTIPTTMSFSFALDKLPLEPLINMGTQLANSGANKDNIAQMAMMNAMMTLPQKLSEAGTTISIKDTMLKHPHYRFNFDGHLKADQASVIGVNGEATVKAVGIKNVITLLETQHIEASEDRKIKIDKMITQLKTLQKFVKDDPNGSDLKTAKFTLDNQGQTLVNSVNIKEIVGETVVLD